MIVPCWLRVASLYCLTNSMMFTPCCPSAGPTGGAADACPAGSWSLSLVRTFFAIESLLQLRDLIERQLYRRLPPEEIEENGDLLLVHLDGVHGTAVAVERAGNDADDLADLVIELRTRTLLGLRREDLCDFARIQRRRLCARSDESGDAGRVAHDVPRVVVQLHPDEDVAGEYLFLNRLHLARLELHHLFGRDDDVVDLVFHIHGLNSGREVRTDLVLVAGVGMDDEPVTGCEEVVLLLIPVLVFVFFGFERFFRHLDGDGRLIDDGVRVRIRGGLRHRLGSGFGRRCGSRLRLRVWCFRFARLAEGRVLDVLFLVFGRRVGAVVVGHGPLGRKSSTIPCAKPRSSANTTPVRTVTTRMTTIEYVMTSWRVGQITRRSSPR